MTVHSTGSQIIRPLLTKEINSPADCLKILEKDFDDRARNEEGSSSDERKFLAMMKEKIEVNESRAL